MFLALLRSRAASVGLLFVLAIAAGCTSAEPGERPERADKLAQAYGAPPTDASALGPLATDSAEYQMPAAVDTDVLDTVPARPVELWARVYYPAPLAGPYPLLVFLHGSHGTCGKIGTSPRLDDSCEYTATGTCPVGYDVVKNHEGYSYVASQLASWGYVVVSVNANLGITCGKGVAGDLGLNLARGRLVLRHLENLSKWNQGTPTPASLGVDLTGKLDFSNVGLLGHSRGGEGMRAAYELFRDAGSPWPGRMEALRFAGILEIGPVDGQTSRILNADGTNWNAILPMCDGDVSDLSGLKPYDRMLTVATEAPALPKSIYTVWGANHNFFNTEWQVSDSTGCLDHKPIFKDAAGPTPQVQRATGLSAIMGFFRGYVGAGADPALARIFDPGYDLPATVTAISRVDRSYTSSPSAKSSLILEDFTGPAGTSSYGLPNDASGLGAVQHGSLTEHDPVANRVALISWADAGAYFQSNWAAAGAGFDLSAYATLDIRLDRQKNVANPATDTNFHVTLVQDDDVQSDPLSISSYASLAGPVGGPNNKIHATLYSARIPFADFTSVDLTRVRGIRLTFDDTPSGAIFVANVRADNYSAIKPIALPPPRIAPDHVKGGGGGEVLVSPPTFRGAAPTLTRNAVGEVEVRLRTGRPVEPKDQLTIVKIGDETFGLVEVSPDLMLLKVSLEDKQLRRIPNGARVLVQYGRDTDASSSVWDFGPFDRASIR